MYIMYLHFNNSSDDIKFTFAGSNGRNDASNA